jgi:hypothetical protein
MNELMCLIVFLEDTALISLELESSHGRTVPKCINVAEC